MLRLGGRGGCVIVYVRSDGVDSVEVVLQSTTR
jgi:hypothetical protein